MQVSNFLPETYFVDYQKARAEKKPKTLSLSYAAFPYNISSKGLFFLNP